MSRRAGRALGVATAVAAALTVGVASPALAAAPRPGPGFRSAGLLAGTASLRASLEQLRALSPLPLDLTGLAALDPGYDASSDPGSLYSLEVATGVRGLWAEGDTGRGVGVALIDSGVSPVAGLGRVQNGPDLTSTAGTLQQGVDGFGHGTHMAGIIAGHDGLATGAALARSRPGQFEGVAPDASVIDVKVAEASGWTDPSRVIAGIAWAIRHKDDPGRDIRVINLSYGTDAGDSYRSDLLAYAVEQAWKAGIVVVAAAGNDGTDPGRLDAPAIDPYVIAVGAAAGATAAGGVTAFSQQGTASRSPDVVAPGVLVQSLRAPDSTLQRGLAATGAMQQRFLSGSGTSQATAYVSGLVALMLQADPSLTPDQVKARLVSTADPVAGASSRVAGHGLVDVRAAEDADVSAAAAAQVWAPALGTGTLDAARGSAGWIAAGATAAVAEDPALGANGTQGLAWADQAWAGRSWAGDDWAEDGASDMLAGRSWAGRSWAGRSWEAR